MQICAEFFEHMTNSTTRWLSYVLGISSLSPENYAQFKLSFLSSLYSGVITGVVTGIIVGIVIIGFQKSVEKRQLKNVLEKELSIFKEKARLFLAKSGSYNLTDLEKAPEYVTQILALIESNPLDVWNDHLPSHRSLISKVRELQNAFFKFSLVGSHLDNKIIKFIRKYNADRELCAGNDTRIYAYYVGKLENMTDEDILAWLDLPSKVITKIKSDYSELRNDKHILQLEKEYVERKCALESAVTALREFLG